MPILSFQEQRLSAVFRYFIYLYLVCHATSGWACSEESCIETNSWQLGVAIGLGAKTNPLVGGDNIPLVILPDIAWYAEQAYFDNGELGYQWINKTNYALESFVQLDQERAFFSFFHPANIFMPSISNSISASQPFGPSSPNDIPLQESTVFPSDSKLSINQISKRKWAINAGLRWHYFLDNMEWEVSWQNDISGVHKGQIIELAYRISWAWHKINVNTQFGAKWKSAKLIDYYYGIDQHDTNDIQQWFTADAGVTPYISINIQKPINANWSWISSLHYQKLPSSMTLSPLVEESSVRRLFVGAAYRF